MKQSPSRGSRYAPSEDMSRGDELSGDPNAIIPSQKFENGRLFALATNTDDIINKHKQCERSTWSEGSGPHPRKLRYIVPWPKITRMARRGPQTAKMVWTSCVKS